MLIEGSPIVVRTHNWRRRLYTVIQGCEGHVYKAYSGIGALRQTRLIPGSKVTVFVPQIVHAKRAPRTVRKLAQMYAKRIPNGMRHDD